jgi:hypothetical protein
MPLKKFLATFFVTIVIGGVILVAVLWYANVVAGIVRHNETRDYCEIQQCR